MTLTAWWAVLAIALVSAATAQDTRPATQPDAGALRREAFAAAAAGEHGAAAEAFRRLAELEPQNPDWFVHAADNLGKVGRFNDAMDLLGPVCERFPDVPEILVMLARIYHLKADSMVAEAGFDVNVAFYYEDTIRAAEQVLAMNPQHLEALLLLASARFQLGDQDGALAAAERAVATRPADYGAQAMLGKVALQQFVDAKRRADADPAAVDALRARAEAALAAAAKADPQRGYPVAKLGDILAWSGELDRALVRYREALAIEPGANVDHGWLRTASAASDRIALYEGALGDYRARGGEAAREAGILEWYAAQAHFDARDYAAARAGFARALKARPEFTATHFWLMQAAYWSGDEKAALAHAVTLAEREPRVFADMIRGDEQITAVLRGMAQKAYESGKLVACRELNHVLAFAANTADEWNNYALLCRDTKQYAESFAAYEHALGIERSPQLLNDAAVILHYHLASPENLATARGYYERAIEMAEEMLRGELGAEVEARTRTALRDAKMNLRALR